jgi:ribonuclease P protein component
MSSQALPAAQRIRRRLDFERIYKEGARVHGRFMTLFVMPNGRTVPRFGVAATRKIGSAVERNRAKRLSREVFRRRKVAAGLDVVVVPRREMLDAPFATLETDYSAALERGGRYAGSPSPSRHHRRHRPRGNKSV